MYFTQPVFQHILSYVGDLKKERQKEKHTIVMNEIKALAVDWHEWNTVIQSVDFLCYIEWYRLTCEQQLVTFTQQHPHCETNF